MIMNWQEEITKIDPDIKFRAQGGWLKTVTKLDKTVKNGYSLVGDFVNAGDFEDDYSEGLYLDCNKEGSGKKPQTDYRLLVSPMSPEEEALSLLKVLNLISM